MAVMSRRRLSLITAGIMLSLFLSSMEGTVVATAMPSIVAEMGGLSIYSWVFSIYMLTSTTSVPIYGKLSDLFGRKRVYAVSMFLFLVGSVVCAQATRMEQLILFRGIQGLGAGGVLPLAFTIVGELFTLQQRARLQGLFSGVWGVSAVIGPLIGGFLVDQVSWQWVFLINVVPGLVAALLVWFAWQEQPAPAGRKVNIDFLGAALLTVGALCLLLGLNELGQARSVPFLGAAVVLIAAFPWAEKRAVDPILPLHLFRDRLFTTSILHGILAGWAMFGSLNFVPLFVQGVLGTSATQAGVSLTPMSLSWTLASIFSSRLLLRMSYRSLALAGMVLLVIGTLLMTTIGMETSILQVMVYTGLMGLGMGLSIPAYLIAVQSTVRREELGVATSTLQFSRSIGGTVGVSVLGAYLSARLAAVLLAVGGEPGAVSLEKLLDPLQRSAAVTEGPLRAALSTAISNMFFISLAAALAGLLVVFFTPRGRLGQEEKEPVSG